LTETIYMGFKNLIGSDVSDKAITDTEKNIEWISSLSSQGEATKKSLDIFQHDATTPSQKLETNSVDKIISEPYLGKPLTGHETKKFFTKTRTGVKRIIR